MGPQQNENKIKKSNPKNSNNQRILELTSSRNHTLLFLITEGSGKVSKGCAVTMGCRCTSKEVQPSKTSQWIPRTKIPCRREVESSIDINVTGWSVMRNTMVNQEHLERGSKNISSPPIFDHYNTTGHEVSLENFSIVGKEEQNLMRTMKEALYIRVNNPSLNRNIDKYHLPHIWDEVLFNTSELKLK